MNKQQYREATQQQQLYFSRFCSYIGIALILLGTALDYALYPEQYFIFLTTRIITSAAIFLIILILQTNWGGKHVSALTFSWLLLPQIMITWMIAQTEGAASLFFVGLHLAIFASGIALHFTMLQNIAFSIATYLLYATACFFHMPPFVPQNLFFLNSLFLAMSAVISALCTFFNQKTRFSLFELKEDLAQKNSKLEHMNKELIKVKGHMLHQEKMAAIGTLSAGLLHEINNPLNCCLIATEMALGSVTIKNDELLQEYLKDTQTGIARIREIVSRLRTFAYRQPASLEENVESKMFSFAAAVNFAVKLIAHELKGITVSTSVPSNSNVLGDESAIISVLINLLNNAAIALHSVHRTQPSIEITATWEEGRLRVKVRDNGSGIPAENLERIFEPFFTTKEVGKGLGLGLSISYGIIERHGSLLTVESRMGEWTEMSFDLPAKNNQF